jgi:pimeloyl-ACP methyl ester carboxylesterase
MRAVAATPALVRQAFFSAHTPASVVPDCAARLQQSHRAMSIDMLRGDLPRPERVAAPLLVLGGRDDWLIGAKQVRATAAVYGTAVEFHPMGHNVMLEPGWAAVAARIDGWLGARGL